MIETDFDVPFVAGLALREKQIQQNYRPVIAVHKWFARRPGTLFRGLLLAEFAKGALSQTFYMPNRLPGVRVADPFMGGGTPLLEANRLGCDVVGRDINPMSNWIVRREIEHLDLSEYLREADRLRESLEASVGHLYRTRCLCCGFADAPVKYFLWVKTATCSSCGANVDLFPGSLVAADSRHPANVFVCLACGELTETSDRRNPGKCSNCSVDLSSHSFASRGHCRCHECGNLVSYPTPNDGAPSHRLFALEYHCTECRSRHTGRYFKSPDAGDTESVRLASTLLAGTTTNYIPDEKIPSGDETNRLHRWGYRRYREMFNERQLLGLSFSAEFISRVQNDRVADALSTNLSDLLRYQNMLCRYDTRALKSLDIFSVHGFPVGLVQCESNLLGIPSGRKGTCVGSGGWANIIAKYQKAKSYCDAPFEVKHDGRTKKTVIVAGEWIGDRRDDSSPEERGVDIACDDSATMVLEENSLDAVLTDPPYFGNVQYAELMDFCYVWLRRLARHDPEQFAMESTRNSAELTGNDDMGRGLDHFAEGLSSVFRNMSHALKPGAPLAFTYHHNEIDAYLPVAVALLDSGLTCSGSLPCPAEMGASIHISGTGSSIIDTIFVCRSTGKVPRKWVVESTEAVAELVEEDLKLLARGNVKPTLGDARCITFGHLVRLAIWNLRATWDKTAPVNRRMCTVSDWLKSFGTWADVRQRLELETEQHAPLPLLEMRETLDAYGEPDAYISF